MRKLIESTLVSLDGVIEAPDQWSIFHEESTALALEQLDHYDAFSWDGLPTRSSSPNGPRLGGNPYTNRINAMPNYVASRSLTEAPPNVALLGPDAAGAIAGLKQQPGQDLIKYGTSRLDDQLLREHLLDELHDARLARRSRPRESSGRHGPGAWPLAVPPPASLAWRDSRATLNSSWATY